MLTRGTHRQDVRSRVPRARGCTNKSENPCLLSRENPIPRGRIAEIVVTYLFDPALPQVPIARMVEAQIQMPGLAMMTLLGMLAHVTLLSDPGKPGDTQNEFAET